MKSTRPGVLTYVVASNHLAGTYLVQVLAKDRFARPILCEQLPQARLRSVSTVFVIEGSSVPLPLSECIRRLRTLFRKARFVVVDRPQPNEEIMRLIALGVQGFVEHSKVTEALADAVRAVSAGRFWIADDLLQAYVRLTTEAKQSRAAGSQIPTPREAEILELVRQRLSNREIGAILGVQESTVKYHVSHVLTKYRVKGRRALEAKAPTVQVWEQPWR